MWCPNSSLAEGKCGWDLGSWDLGTTTHMLTTHVNTCDSWNVAQKRKKGNYLQPLHATLCFFLDKVNSAKQPIKHMERD